METIWVLLIGSIRPPFRLSVIANETSTTEYSKHISSLAGAQYINFQLSISTLTDLFYPTQLTNAIELISNKQGFTSMELMHLMMFLFIIHIISYQFCESKIMVLIKANSQQNGKIRHFLGLHLDLEDRPRSRHHPLAALK